MPFFFLKTIDKWYAIIILCKQWRGDKSIEF